MKKTQHKAYSLTVICRTEDGRCEVELGLDNEPPENRAFLFHTLRRTQQGGTAQLGLHETGPGEKTLSLLLKENTPIATGVRASMINGTH